MISVFCILPTQLSRGSTVQISEQEFGEHLPGIIKRLPSGGERVLALTIDLCDGSGNNSYDDELIGMLVRRKVSTTFFISGRWLKHHQSKLQKLKRHAFFDIQNHGTRHKPASSKPRRVYGISSTKNMAEVKTEIFSLHNQVRKSFGDKMRFYRPGTAFIDRQALEYAQKNQYEVIGYSISAGDAIHPFNRRKILRDSLELALVTSFWHMVTTKIGKRRKL